MKILLTGASGYLGSQLMDLWLKDEDVEKIVAIDLNEPKFLFEKNHPKIHFIKGNLADISLDQIPESFLPLDAVLHAAYLIRTPYFNRSYHKHSNFEGAEKVFKFAFESNVSKLIHFSTVAVYGAKKTNTLTYHFKEEDERREDKITYGKDKKVIEENLENLFKNHQTQTQVFVLRIGSVSGPFGKFIAKKKGLQSFLRGSLPFIPIIGEKSARQFIHEDDIVNAVDFCLRSPRFENNLIPLNLAPNGFLTFREIAKLQGKKIIKLPKFFFDLGFWFLWHLSFGKIPTPPSVANSYAYPIIVDGLKITRHGFRYTHTGLSAFLSLKGKFASKENLPKI